MNKNTRLWGAAMATLLAAATVAGCSTGGGSSAQDPNGKITGSITITSVDGLATDVAKAFEKKYPGTKVTVQVVSDINTIQQQVRTQLTSGTAPDIFTAWPGNGSPTAVQVLGAAGDFMYDLSDRPWVKDMPANLIASGSYKGKVYDALYGVNGIGAIYNMDTLKADGAKPATTWSEVLGLCATAQKNGKVAFALGNQDQWITQLINYALTATLVYGPDPKFSEEQAAGKATFADSKWATAFDKYQEMTDAGCFEADPLSTDYAATQTMVATGAAYAAVNGNWMIGEIKKAGPDGTYELFPFPATDNASDTYMPVAAGAGLAVNKKTKNLATALAYVDFAESPEGLGIAVPIQGGLSPYPVDTVKVDASLENISKFMADGKAASFPDQGWPNAKVQSEHLSGVQDIFAGKATPADVMKKMQAAFDEGN